MHPAISHHLAQAHVADLRQRAQRDTLARPARRVRRNQPGLALSRLGAWGRRGQARLMARTIRGYQRHPDSPVAQTQRPLPCPFGTCSETHPHRGIPAPNSERTETLLVDSRRPRTPTRAHPILSSPSE
jgi:hypothetical protein